MDKIASGIMPWPTDRYASASKETQAAFDAMLEECPEMFRRKAFRRKRDAGSAFDRIYKSEKKRLGLTDEEMVEHFKKLARSYKGFRNISIQRGHNL